MAGNKADEKAKTEAPKTAAKAAPAQKFVHILTLGHGAATRNVQLITDSPKAPKVFEEFITGFRSYRPDLDPDAEGSRFRHPYERDRLL